MFTSCTNVFRWCNQSLCYKNILMYCWCCESFRKYLVLGLECTCYLLEIMACFRLAYSGVCRSCVEITCKHLLQWNMILRGIFIKYYSIDSSLLLICSQNSIKFMILLNWITFSVNVLPDLPKLENVSCHYNFQKGTLS